MGIFQVFLNSTNATKSHKACHVKSVDRKMLSGIDWAIFFNNPENKKDLINLIYPYFLTD